VFAYLPLLVIDIFFFLSSLTLFLDPVLELTNRGPFLAFTPLHIF
jgi:hypothetical protein